MKNSNYHFIINVGSAPYMLLINKILQLAISMGMCTSDGEEINFTAKFLRMW